MLLDTIAFPDSSNYANVRYRLKGTHQIIFVDPPINNPDPFIDNINYYIGSKSVLRKVIPEKEYFTSAKFQYTDLKTDPRLNIEYELLLFDQ